MLKSKIFKKYSLLYVGNDKSISSRVEDSLKNYFKKIYIAKDAKDALKIFKEHKIYIVITELELAQMDGVELARVIKDIEKKVFVVAINSYDNTDKLIEAINMGFDKYLLKPFKLSTLLKILKEIIYILEQDIRLNKSEERLKLALEGAGDGLWDWNIQTNKVYYSSRWFKILGYRDGELNYNFDTFKKVCYPNDFKKVIEKIKSNLIKKSNNYEIEHRMVKKNGDILWILDRGKTLFNEHNEAIRMVGHITDITDRKNMENTLCEKTRLLKELNQSLEKRVLQEVNKRRAGDQLLIQQSKMAAMGEMIGAIAHQWKQPLNVLSLLLQDLEEMYEFEELNEKNLTEVIGSSMKQIDFMSETVNDFRNFFKPTKEKSLFSIKNAIEKIYNLLSPQFKSHYIDVNIEGSDVETSGYSNEFKQVILNILNNAKDAIDNKRELSSKENISFKGEINININIKSNLIFIEVYDNGNGIPKDIKKTLFNPYITTKGEGGTGVGLYMSKTIIEENMGGKLYFEDVTNGAKFIIELPIKEKLI